MAQQDVGLILDIDPDLGAGVCAEDWESARSMCKGKLLRVAAGVWQLPAWAGESDDLLGLVIVDGLVCREVALRDRFTFELLGPGDVLSLPVMAERPRLGGPVQLTATATTTLLVLGESFVRAAAQWPSLLAAVLRRLEAQRERLAIQGLINHLPRVEHRLLLGLWHLADRWGRVTPGGTLLPLPLTHDLLGQLAASRRSTTTLAVRALESDGYVRRMDDGSWLLTALAEREIDAIGRTRGTARLVGESLMLRQRTAEVRQESRAVRAEARQIRSQDKGSGRGLAKR